MGDYDTAKTILSARMRLRNSNTIAAVKAHDVMTAGEREAQEISDSLRAHPGPDNDGPSKPEDVDHGEYK